MVRVGIIGASGFAGEELLAILLRHAHVSIKHLSAKIDAARPITELFPRFKNQIDLVCGLPDAAAAAASCECVFLALPHTVSLSFVPELLKAGVRVIDLSADYRFRDAGVYEKHYHTKHPDAASLKKAVYGLTELYRQDVARAHFVANPGCYPTAAILGLAPLLSCAHDSLDTASIIIDAKSGVSGAGRKVHESFIFCEVNEDFRAYKVDAHQHAPEIDQELSRLAGTRLSATFVPHLLPLNRGILETIYVRKKPGKKAQDLKALKLFQRFYKEEPFVRVREAGVFPRLRDVVNTNFCDIGVYETSDKIIVISAIDNLLKGAAGQAVQNFNVMFGFPQTQGLA